MLVRLEDMEDKVADLIYKYSKDLHYKEVYKKIKEELDGKWWGMEMWFKISMCKILWKQKQQTPMWNK